MTLSPIEVRARSLLIAGQAGVVVPSTLPLLAPGVGSRSRDAVVERLLTLHAVIAAAYGFERAKSVAWLEREGLMDATSGVERGFLERGEGNRPALCSQVEAMWALAWGLGIAPVLDFWSECDGAFVRMMPNLLVMESSAEFRARGVLRGAVELNAARDLGYCLHGAVRQAALDGAGPPSGLVADIVVERRRGLEWLVGTGSWDDVVVEV